MKKFYFILLANIAFTHLALADCLLDKPIAIGTKPVLQTDQNKMIRFHHVVFDKAHKTKMIPPVASIADMRLTLFEIRWSPETFGTPKPTGYAGAKFGPIDGSSQAGFSYDYGGNFSFEGSTKVSGGVTTYTTSEVSKTEVGSPRTSTSISVEGGRIIGIEVTVPVRDKVQTAGGSFYYPYMGENEILCLRSAELE